MAKILQDIAAMMSSAAKKREADLNRIGELEQQNRALRRQRPTNAELIVNFNNMIDRLEASWWKRAKDKLSADLHVGADGFAGSEVIDELIAAGCGDTLKRKFA